VLRVNSHEIAHQWTGDLVTCKWWDSIYLNEGVTEFVMYIAADIVEPDFIIWDNFYTLEFDSVMQLDGTTRSYPTIQVVNDSKDADFSSITYDRGSSTVRMWLHILTEETFVAAMQNYLNDRSFDTAVFEDLWEAFQAQADADGTLAEPGDIRAIFEPYLTQANYPLLTVTRDYNGAATLSQQRFLTDGPTNEDDDYQWYVPITYVATGGDFDGSTHPEYFLPPNTQTAIDLDGVADDEAVIFNPKSAMYLRVNYDEDNWELIVNALTSDYTQIHVENRAALIADAFALAEAGIQDYELALNLLAYLSDETAEDPLLIALKNYDRLVDNAGDPAIAAIVDTLENVVDQQYTRIGIEDVDGRSLPEQMVQYRIANYAEVMRNAAFESDSRELFDQWMAADDPDDPAQNPINRHIRRSVYCAGARDIGDSTEDFLVARRAASALPQERASINYALSCVRNGKKLGEFVEDAVFTRHFHQEEAQEVFENAVKKDRDLALKWLNENLDETIRRRGVKFVDNAVTALAHEFAKKSKDDRSLSAIEHFAETHSKRLSKESHRFLEWAKGEVRANM